MTENEYLEAILRSQLLTGDSEEIKKLHEHREKVEALIREKFARSSPTIRYGGSKAKGTMIKMAYDLDLICYFPHDETGPGETLEEIYRNVEAALRDDYSTDPKTSAIRLRDPKDFTDFHIDVVPGRFVDGDAGDVFLYQSSAERCRLKTNLEVHLKHIRDSGVTDAICMIKFWAVRNSLNVKTFVLELLVVDLLKGKKDVALATQLRHVWTAFRDRAKTLAVQDPANPEGNDLSSYLDSIRDRLSLAAGTSLTNAENDNWQAIFGDVQGASKEEQVSSLRRIAASVTAPSKPWYCER